MHVAAFCLCLLTAGGNVPRPPVEAPTPVLVPMRTLDNRTVGFFTGWDAILHCAMVGDDDTLVKLLKEGHDLNPPFNNRGGTVLHIAVHQGTPKTVKLLVEHGADVNARIDDGPSPLEVARNRARNDPTRRSIVNILLKHRAK
ncbi:MAG: ankyrin repeat domain-containing protein [Planctomycetaceae bacterium]